MNKPLKVLIVEDNPDDAELLKLELTYNGFQVEAERVDTPDSFQKALEKTRWDIIFSDHSMPRFSSFKALELRNAAGMDIPFIILSGTMGEELAVEAMKTGASDYFVKGRLTRLGGVVKRELQEAEEREKRRNSEWELEHFVASLTHDLRTPILAEHRVLELIEQEKLGPLTEAQRDMIRELIKANQFVQHMVNNILFAYKYRQNKVHLNPEQTSLAEFLAAVIASMPIVTLVSEKAHELICEPIDPKLPPVRIDRNEMQRVLLNLIKNATDYTPPGGKITLFAQQPDGGFIRIGVQDTGPGVDTEMEPYLFTLYAASAAKKFRKLGLGLGLYLSRRILEAHGGSISYSKQSDGSLFYFDLPVETLSLEGTSGTSAGDSNKEASFS